MKVHFKKTIIKNKEAKQANSIGTMREICKTYPILLATAKHNVWVFLVNISNRNTHNVGVIHKS